MAWSEIKKAVNSDISTPLNTLITNLISQVKNYISTAGNVKVVRKVQRGTFSPPPRIGNPSFLAGVSYTTTITLSGFTNTEKMSVKLYGTVFSPSQTSTTGVSGRTPLYVEALTTAALSVRIPSVGNGSSYSNTLTDTPLSYEVIEFY